MTIFQFICVMVLLVFGLWANNTYSTPPWKTIFNAIIVIVLILVLLMLLGFSPNLNQRI